MSFQVMPLVPAEKGFPPETRPFEVENQSTCALGKYSLFLGRLQSHSPTSGDEDKDSVVGGSHSEDDEYFGEEQSRLCVRCGRDMPPQPHPSTSPCSEPYELDMEPPTPPLLAKSRPHSPLAPPSIPPPPRDGPDPEVSPAHPYYSPSVSSIRDAVSHLTRLDDFNVIKLSHGFFSQVFKVKHFSTKKTMVLKMNKNAGNRANALKEIELLNKLNHPNIVAYMGTVVHEGTLHPLLEYINGGTLEQLVRQFYSAESRSSVHRLADPDWTFVRLMWDVCRGMDYLHSRQYLHRDLASKNVFIRKNVADCDSEFDDHFLEAVIGDFGFATSEPSREQKLRTVGSPYWLAPECFRHQWYNHKCDIYSFGVVCCELNWSIPADPDYLPRFDDNFAVDFSQLHTKTDTLLARVAQRACQIEPESRPEFHSILATFDTEASKRPSKGSQHTFARKPHSIHSLPEPCPLDADVFEQHLQRRRYSNLIESNEVSCRHR